VGPLAAPGVTGDKVPGATRMAPNVPAPFASPRTLLTSPAESPGTLPDTAGPRTPR